MESVPSFSIAVMSSSSALTPSKVPSSGELARSLLASDSGSLVVALGSRSPWPTLGRKGFILKGKKRGNTSQIAAAGRLAPRHSPAAEADTLSLINSGSLERDCDVTRGGEGPARRLARSQRLNPFHNHLGCLLALKQVARQSTRPRVSPAPGPAGRRRGKSEGSLTSPLGTCCCACRSDLPAEASARRATRAAS